MVALLSSASLPGCSLEDALNAGTSDTEASGESTGAIATGSSSAATADDTTDPAPDCADRVVRLATYNVQTVGPPGSEGFDALGAIARRIDADVMCLQEVQFEENASFVALAEEAGYTHAVQANRSPAIGGDHTNACVGRVPLEIVGSWGGRDLSSDFDANDVGRDILAVRAFVGAADGDECHVGVLTVHLKSGQDSLDLFRRQVEIERLRQAIARYREAHPADPLVVLGDLNESLDDPAIGVTFDAIPSGLPESYDVGSDIAFPLQYQPFAALQSEGLSLTQPTQEDSPDSFATWGDTVRLDYVWYAGAELLDDEVYNSCRDDGVDAEPAGNAMSKSGEPLSCGVSMDASDHFAVFADLRLE